MSAQSVITLPPSTYPTHDREHPGVEATTLLDAVSDPDTVLEAILMTATDDDLLLAVGAYGTIFAIEGSEDRGKSYNVRRSVKDSLPGQPEEIVSSKSFGALDILIKKEPPTPSLVALTDVLIELVAQNHKLEKMLSESNRSRDTAEGQGDSAGSAQTGALLDGARKVLHGLRGKAEQGGNGNVP